jgi:hypothetical protein
MSVKRKNDSGQIYTPGLPMRLFTLLMGLFAAGVHAYIVRMWRIDDPTFPIAFLLFILLFDAWMLWYGYIFMTQTRVFVSEEGIELQRGGSRQFAAWENISHFGIKGGGKNQQRGIYLYDKVTPQTSGIAERLFFGRKTAFIPIGLALNLPTHWGFFRKDINLEKLAQTDFGRDVAMYAPHLLEEAEKDKRKNQFQPDWLLSHKKYYEVAYFVGADENALRKHKR